MSHLILQCAFYLVLLVLLAIPLGSYCAKVMNGERVFLSPVLRPIERVVYKLTRIDELEEMGYKRYAFSALIFNLFGFALLYALVLLQGHLPGNPQHVPGMSWHLGLNTALSFVTNTNWQAYSGEAQAGYLTQALGLTVQNFVSAGTGIAVLFALIRGFARVEKKGLGSFWTDLTRSIVYILLPLCLVLSIGLVSQGVIQNLKPAQEIHLLQPVAVDKNGAVIHGAKIDIADKTVTLNGQILKDATIITDEFVPMGPAASQVAIKQIGTNGGGFTGVNSAHPLENPTPFSNLLEMLSLLLIPMALCFTFGRNIKDKRQGRALFAAMFIVLLIGLSVLVAAEQHGTAELAQNGAVNISMDGQDGGNMEGKEARFGVPASSTWAAFTTAASNGAVNSMHDSYTPTGSLVPLIFMQLGEVIFGGVGSGLYGMLAFVILTVFIAGLMVGRTPEYLGKKIEPFEMKWAVMVCLATPIAILVGSGVAAAVPQVARSISNPGAHGFSEMLYAYTSAGANNGSAFAGFNADTAFLNVSLALCMLVARYLPIYGTLAIAGSMAAKKKLAVTPGTLSTTKPLFVFLLIFVVLLIGALSFFPALALGPIAEALRH